ncbi:hypothetical protein ACROYT_G015534 [Oculina patagonica]
MARENLLFAGLWFGEKKPLMWTFLKPHISARKGLEAGLQQCQLHPQAAGHQQYQPLGVDQQQHKLHPPAASCQQFQLLTTYHHELQFCLQAAAQLKINMMKMKKLPLFVQVTVSELSSHSLSDLVGNSNFFNQAKQLLKDFEKKKIRLATLRSKFLLNGVDERLLENAGLGSLAESVARALCL